MPKLIVPVGARHVSQALAEAKRGPDEFRRAEIRWLERHRAPLIAGMKKVYALNMRHGGPENADPYLLGGVLGHRAVRLCTDEYGGYGATYQICQHNIEVAGRPDVQITDPWDTQEMLTQVFGDEEVVGALLEIGYSATRASAASLIGHLCLDEIPGVPVKWQ